MKNVAVTGFLLLSQVPAPDAASYSGWAGAGILTGVLGWLMFVHLPSKDKQLKEMMESKDKLVEVKDGQLKDILQLAAQERERDRVARHEQGALYQRALTETCNEFKQDMEAERAACAAREQVIIKSIENMMNGMKK